MTIRPAALETQLAREQQIEVVTPIKCTYLSRSLAAALMITAQTAATAFTTAWQDSANALEEFRYHRQGVSQANSRLAVLADML